MLDTDFSRTVRAAQAGDEAAFVRLWRDANPLLVRYLRVVGYDDPYDGACEAWITVVRGLPQFTGDDMDWLVWLLSCARLRAHEGSLRRAWGSVEVTPGVGLPVGAPQRHTVEDDLAAAAVEDPRTRGIADSLAALRSLPLGQGEVLVLRFGAGLSARDTARVAGVDEVTVRRLTQRGLERLGVDQDLLRWSLTAPRSVAELADERVVVGAFSGHGGSGGSAGHRTGGRRPGGRSADRRPGTARSGPARPGARVIATVRVPGAAAPERRGGPASAARRGATSAARRSRGAALAVGVVAASVMSLGGLGAAAYVGVLPAPVQQAMHDAIGAPAPQGGPGRPGSSASGASGTSSASTTRTTPGGRAGGAGPAGSPSAAAVTGLCRAWAADQAAGTARDRSTAFRDLAQRAGGAAQVPAYCSAAAAAPTSQAVPGPGQGSGSHPGGTPARTPARTPNPHSTSPGKGTVRTPDPHPTTPRSTTPRSTTPRPGTSRPAVPGGTKPAAGTTNGSTPRPNGTGKGATRTAATTGTTGTTGTAGTGSAGTAAVGTGGSGAGPAGRTASKP
ncbi:hypothetical protein GCM10027517_28600 [Phycicoccus ginsengisoli]